MTQDEAKRLLEQEGYVILKARSYRAAQERQRVAEALLQCANRDAESSRGWAKDCLAEERRLRDRCTFLYGLAAAKGATSLELAGVADPAPVTDTSREPHTPEEWAEWGDWEADPAPATEGEDQ